MDPFEDALRKANQGRMGTIEQGMENVIRFWASEQMPEGEVRVLNLKNIEHYTVTAGNGVTDHWLKMTGRKPVKFARSGTEVKGNTFRVWVDSWPIK